MFLIIPHPHSSLLKRKNHYPKYLYHNEGTKVHNRECAHKNKKITFTGNSDDRFSIEIPKNRDCTCNFFRFTL